MHFKLSFFRATTCVSVVLFLLFLTMPNQAAAQFINPSFKLSHVTKEYEDITLSVDTRGSVLNAFEVTISYDQEKMTFNSVSENKQLGVLWVKQPLVQNGTIVLSGIVPTGFYTTFDPVTQNSTPTPLAHIFLTAKTQGTTSVDVIQGFLYKHDGFGTRIIPIDEAAVSFVLSSQGTISRDTTPPVINSVLPYETKRSQTGSLFVDAYDTESGIAAIEFKEYAQWSVVQNPIAFKQPFFEKVVSVRVTDGAGNSAVSEVIIPGVFPLSVKTIIILSIGIILLILLLGRNKKRS